MPCSSLFCFYIVASDSQFKRESRHWELPFLPKWILHFFVSSNLCFSTVILYSSVILNPCEAIIIINYNFVLKKFIIREKLNNFQFNQNFVDIEQVIKVKWYMYIIYTRLAVQTKLLFMNITRFDSLVTNMIISSSYHWYD